MKRGMRVRPRLVGVVGYDPICYLSVAFLVAASRLSVCVSEPHTPITARELLETS